MSSESKEKSDSNHPVSVFCFLPVQARLGSIKPDGDAREDDKESQNIPITFARSSQKGTSQNNNRTGGEAAGRNVVTGNIERHLMCSAARCVGSKIRWNPDIVGTWYRAKRKWNTRAFFCLASHTNALMTFRCDGHVFWCSIQVQCRFYQRRLWFFHPLDYDAAIKE